MKLAERKANPAVTAMLAKALTISEMEKVSGGHDFDSKDHCCGSPNGSHKWEFTGQTRPGIIFGDLWPDYLCICAYCHESRWMWN